MTLLDQLNNRYDMKWTCKTEMYGVNLDTPYPTYRSSTFKTKFLNEIVKTRVEITDWNGTHRNRYYAIIWYGEQLYDTADCIDALNEEELIKRLDRFLPIRQNQQIMLDL